MGRVSEQSLTDWRQTLVANADGVLLGTREAIRAMSPAARGSIIDISTLHRPGDVEAQCRRLAELAPLGHAREPRALASGGLFLASDEAKFITGTDR
jgi:NAD(P)-dependent dehydrogenase (short-subunit alcohol dehydrogenase family)